tara:strand:+ start:6 stop:1676 length:1671 start_codon:yes stop_codon:yes gene_type:complete
MIAETLSVGIIIPLLSIFLKGEIGTGIFAIPFNLAEMLGENLLYIGLVVTLIIFLSKNLLLIFNLWHQRKFLRILDLEITGRLFRYYLKNDYLFFIQNNSSYLYRNLTSVVHSFLDYINRYMIFITEFIVFLGITFVLLYVDLIGTIIILISVGFVSFIIYILSRKKIAFFAVQRNTVGGELNKHLLQGMASAKDIKILDRETELISQVDSNLFKMTRLNHLIYFINGLPRFIFEILLVFIFITLIITMAGAKREFVDIIQYLGIFAVAAFRIIPSVTRIFASFQMIKYQEPSVNILIKELNSKHNFGDKNEKQKENLNIPLKFQDSIDLKNLSFTYPSRKDFSLSKITMSIKKGNSVGIIGETGSGKSTLINLLTGLLKPSDGKIEVDNTDINQNLNDWHNKIGYVPQSVYLTDDSIKKNIAFGLKEENIDNSLVEKAINKANLKDFLNNLNDGLETTVGEKGIKLSGGQQQRIGIARALYRDPEILILDEATSSLDQITEKKIMDSVQFLKGNKTLIIITHRLSTVQNCDKIFMIDKGKIVKEGIPKNILNNSK